MIDGAVRTKIAVTEVVRIWWGFGTDIGRILYGFGGNLWYSKMNN